MKERNRSNIIIKILENMTYMVYSCVTQFVHVLE